MTRTPISRHGARTLLRSLVLACACALVAACTTVGNGQLVALDNAGAKAMLVPGTTTRADVLQSLGQGTVIRFQSGFETWHYFYKEGLSKAWDDVPYVNLITTRIERPTKELVILFNDRGLLQRWSFQESRPEPKPGAAPASAPAG